MSYDLPQVHPQRPGEGQDGPGDGVPGSPRPAHGVAGSGRAVVPLLPQAADVRGRRFLRGQDVYQEVQAQRRSGVVVHVRQEGPCWHAVRCRQPARTRRDCSPCPHPATLAPQR